jgi:hypothetical protein
MKSPKRARLRKGGWQAKHGLEKIPKMRNKAGEIQQGCPCLSVMVPEAKMTESTAIGYAAEI